MAGYPKIKETFKEMQGLTWEGKKRRDCSELMSPVSEVVRHAKRRRRGGAEEKEESGEGGGGDSNDLSTGGDRGRRKKDKHSSLASHISARGLYKHPARLRITEHRPNKT